MGEGDLPPNTTNYNAANAFYVYMLLTATAEKETLSQFVTALSTKAPVNIYYQVVAGTVANVYYYCKTAAHIEGFSVAQ